MFGNMVGVIGLVTVLWTAKVFSMEYQGFWDAALLWGEGVLILNTLCVIGLYGWFTLAGWSVKRLNWTGRDESWGVAVVWVICLLAAPIVYVSICLIAFCYNAAKDALD